MHAQRRSFNNEEHFCGICLRNFLGDKFFFLSGCSHYFCTECVKKMVSLGIEKGNIELIKCATPNCKTILNDLDIKNIGLEKNLIDKYEELSLNNAIA